MWAKDIRLYYWNDDISEFDSAQHDGRGLRFLTNDGSQSTDILCKSGASILIFIHSQIVYTGQQLFQDHGFVD